VITANVESQLTLADASDCVLMTNYSGQSCLVRLNGHVAADEYDFKLVDGERAWIRDVRVEYVRVLVNAVAGIRVVYW
jgi:hypothetical protein